MVNCPCHGKEMQEKGKDFYCKISGFWEASELEYLYGKDWKKKLSPK